MRTHWFLLLCVAAVLFSTAASAQNWYNLDDVGGWKSCGTPQCAGGRTTANYNGPIVVGSPSLDGSSARFSFLNPNPGYSNALYWYNTICCTTGVSAPYTQFTYDLYFYIKKANVIQALEFDVNQTISNPSTGTSVRYIFGHECNRKETGTWRIWDPPHGWVNTGITCSMKDNSWIHLVFQQQRTSSGQVYYSTIQVNGTTYAINYYASSYPLSVLADDLNVAFQMDSDVNGDPYSVWLDKITLQAQ
jgi:hypothetical protein